MNIDCGKAPEGWKLVPVIPTQEMRAAAGREEMRAVKEGRQFYAGDSWAPMLNNAPEYMAPINSWNGEGLPPAGTVCEVLWNESRMEYLRTKVFGVNEHGQPIHRFDEGPKKFEYQADVLVTPRGTRVFRPIRTPEQIAAEERDKAIEVMNSLVGDIDAVPSWRDALAALYDAGYRKTEG